MRKKSETRANPVVLPATGLGSGYWPSDTDTKFQSRIDLPIIEPNRIATGSGDMASAVVRRNCG